MRKETATVKTIRANDLDMGGFVVKQALPNPEIDYVDPFLLIHHATTKFHRDRPARIQGVGPHPHKGFSPATFVVQGEIHHRDSRGNDQVAKAGDVQWLHAGMGIIHSERPTQSLLDRDGTQEIIQLWINSPKARKIEIPSYQYMPGQSMPQIVKDGFTVSVVAGSYQESVGPIIPQSPLDIFWLRSAGGIVDLPIKKGYNSLLYVINGKVELMGQTIVKNDLSVFSNTDQLSITATEDTQLLFLSGSPLNEKVTKWGPYVMENQTEIMEAMRDYQMGKMGVLIED